MNTLKKLTKILSIVDIVLCSLTIALSFLRSVLVNVFASSSDKRFDFILWTVIAFLIPVVISVVFFVDRRRDGL